MGTIATTSLAFILLTAVAARADYPHPHPRANPNSCEEMPLALVGPNGLGGIRNRDGSIGGEGTTGPTFPSVCRQGATMHTAGGTT